MAALTALYSRAGEDCFGGAHRRIPVGNSEDKIETWARSVKALLQEG